MGLRTDLSSIIPENLLQYLPEGYEVLGNIAIIEVPSVLAPYYGDIIRALISRKSSLISILNKISDFQGMERTAQYHQIFGTQTITEVREFGFRYKLDVCNVYFSTKMATERKRIAELIMPGESVFVPFAGVGPYVIPAASRGADVTTVEISRHACTWLSLNSSINNVSSHIQIIQGNALQSIYYLKKKFTRIIIPTPYGLIDTPDIFLSKLLSGGSAHWITFCNENQINDCIINLTRKKYMIMRSHPCGNIAPGISRWILDIKKG